MTRKRLLAIFAHPDDESLLAGGTLAACAAAGMDVGILSLTHGELGPIAKPEIVSSELLGQARSTELLAAATALGVTEAECLHFPDGELEWAGEEIEAVLMENLRRNPPDGIVTFGPEGWYWHPDHIAVHHSSMRALERLELEALHPWVYQATWPQHHMRNLVAALKLRGLKTELWGLHPDDFGVPVTDITTVIDVRPFVQSKLRALHSHRSQLHPNHLFGVIPDDVAEEFLGCEFFVRTRSRGKERDWLAESVRNQVSLT